MLTPASSIAILGFGEDCRRFIAALAPRGCALRVFDPRADQTPAGMLLRKRIESLGVDVATDIGSALHAARLVVIDDECPAIGIEAHLATGQMVLDLCHDEAPMSGTTGFRGWFESAGADAHAPQVLNIAGAGAPKLAAALTAIGLRGEAATGSRRPDSTLPRRSALSACTGDTLPPAIHRGELP
jgi:hypothetical protein